MTWSAPTARAAASTWARVASGRPKRMLSRTVPEKKEPVLWELVLLRVPERADLGVQVGADPADLALADAAVSNQRPDQGHGGLCPFASTIGVVSLAIARWLPTQSRPATYTTLRDTTGGRNRRLVPAEVSTV
jgi:hypothetical protein